MLSHSCTGFHTTVWVLIAKLNAFVHFVGIPATTQACLQQQNCLIGPIRTCRRGCSLLKDQKSSENVFRREQSPGWFPSALFPGVLQSPPQLLLVGLTLPFICCNFTHFLCQSTYGSGVYMGLDAWRIYCVEWNTRNASPAKKSREESKPATGRRRKPVQAEGTKKWHLKNSQCV